MVGHSTEDHGGVDNLRSSGIQFYQIDRLHRRFFGLIRLARTNQFAIPRNQLPKKLLSRILFYFEFHMFFLQHNEQRAFRQSDGSATVQDASDTIGQV